jgi:hypothetical protein
MSTVSTITRPTTYERLAELPLVVEAYRLEGLARPWSADFVRRTTVVHLHGGGHVGVGEDVTYTPDDHELLQRAGAVLPLAGTYTLRSFSALLDSLDLFPRPPRRRDSREHRRWAFESAALDLALRQAGLSLAEALGRDPDPVRFVVSMHLGDRPTADPVLARLALYPHLRFKLDATTAWDESLLDQLAATGAVESVDFKGHYEGLPVDGAAAPSCTAESRSDCPTPGSRTRHSRPTRSPPWRRTPRGSPGMRRSARWPTSPSSPCGR